MTYFVGLTGGIATGKSTVANYLRTLGFELIDADVIAHQVLHDNKTVKEQIVAIFGEKLIVDGEINRNALGQLVFGNEVAMKQLTDITGPAIRKKILAAMAAVDNQSEVVFVDIPLLFETGYEKLLSTTVLVDVAPQLQLTRLMKRDGISKEVAQQKIDRQWSLEKKRKLADYVIDNSKTLVETQAQVDRLLIKINQSLLN